MDLSSSKPRATFSMTFWGAVRICSDDLYALNDEHGGFQIDEKNLRAAIINLEQQAKNSRMLTIYRQALAYLEDHKTKDEPEARGL